MQWTTRVLRFLVLIALVAGLMSPLAGPVAAQDAPTEEVSTGEVPVDEAAVEEVAVEETPVEEIVTEVPTEAAVEEPPVETEVTTGNLLLLVQDSTGTPVDGGCFVLDGDPTFTYCTGWGGTSGAVRIDSLTTGDHLIEMTDIPAGYAPAESRSVSVEAGGTAEVLFIVTPVETAVEEAPPTATAETASDGNTAAGSDISVTPSGLPGAVITFDTVSLAGETTVTSLGDAPALPRGFLLVGSTSFDIATTAAFSGALVCLPFEPASVADPSAVRLLHFEDGTWVDVTTGTPDVTNGLVCGRVTSFSPFAPVVVDSTDPEISFISPADGDTVDDILTLTTDASDASGIAEVRFKYTSTPDDSESWTSITDADGANGWSVDVDTTELPNGEYTLRAVAEDLAGNTHTAQIVVTLANVPPTQVPPTATAESLVTKPPAEENPVDATPVVEEETPPSFEAASANGPNGLQFDLSSDRDTVMVGEWASFTLRMANTLAGQQTTYFGGITDDFQCLQNGSVVAHNSFVLLGAADGQTGGSDEVICTWTWPAMISDGLNGQMTQGVTIQLDENYGPNYWQGSVSVPVVAGGVQLATSTQADRMSAALGDEIAVTVTVENTGGIDLVDGLFNSLVIYDMTAGGTQLNPLTCTVGGMPVDHRNVTLAAGASIVCVLPTLTVTQEDVTTGGKTISLLLETPIGQQDIAAFTILVAGIPEPTPTPDALNGSLAITTFGFDTNGERVLGACYLARYPADSLDAGQQVPFSALCDYSDGADDGVTTIPLAPGHYVLENWGYGRWYDQMPAQNVTVGAGEPTAIAVTLDRPLGVSQLDIVTVDGLGVAVLNNCFQISGDVYNSIYLGAACDGDDGVVDGSTLVRKLEPGLVTVFQAGYVPGHALAAPVENLPIGEGMNTVTVVSDRAANLTLRVVDASDNVTPVISGWCFWLDRDVSVDGSSTFQFAAYGCDNNADVVTGGPDGVFTFGGLIPGTYRLTEANPAPGYLNLTTPVTATVVLDSDNQATIELDRAATFTVNSVDDEWAPLAGGCFYLYDDLSQLDYRGGACVSSASSDGQALVDHVVPGTYYLIQINDVAGHDRARPTQVVLLPGTNDPVYMISPRTMAPTTGDLVIYRYDNEGNLLGNGCVEVMRPPVGSSTEECDFDGDGIIELLGVPVGTYDFWDMAPPDGYDRVEMIATAFVTAGGTAIIEIVHNPPGGTPTAGLTGDLIIRWVDTDGNSLGEGCAHVYHNVSNGLSQQYCGTDIELLNIPVGSYTVDEVTAPEGYDLLEYGIDVTVSAGRTTYAELVHEPSGPRGDLAFTALNDLGEPLVDACYYLATADDPDNWVGNGCDNYDGISDGLFEITGAPEGDYLLKEFSTPYGYAPLAEQTVTVTANETTPYTFTSAPVEGYGFLTIEAVSDSDLLMGACWKVSGTEAATAGFDQQVCDSYGVYDGRTQFLYIPAGEYSIVSQQAPIGHAPAAPSVVTIVLGQTKVVTIEHTAGSSLSVITVDADGQSISGACIEIYVDAGDGTAGAFAQFSCDYEYYDGFQDGTIRTSGFPAGEYVFSFSSAPSGYSAPAETFPFSVLPDGSVVTPDGTGTVTATFDRAGGLTASFVDENGESIPEGLCFEVYTAAGSGARGQNIYGIGAALCPGTYSPDGESVTMDVLYVSNLAAGNYLLAQRPTGTIYTLSPDFAFTVASGVTQDVTVTLGADVPDQAMELDLSVVNDRGYPISSARIGQTVTVAHTITNSGTTDLTNVVVNSALFPTGGTLDIFYAAWGRYTFWPNYTVTDADAAAGKVVFDATLTTDGLPPITKSIEITVVAPPNTDAVSGVQVTPAGGSGGTLTFDDITGAGYSAITSLDDDDAPALPGNFSIEGAAFYEIDTTAVFDGLVTVCIPYDEATLGPSRLLHFEGGVWVDVTDNSLSSAGLACGRVRSFSPFAVVQLADTDPPVLTVPVATVTVEATSSAGAAVAFTVTAIDAVDPNPVVVCQVNGNTVVSGGVFTLGQHMVTCTASDANGNESTKSFSIVVRDTLKPVMSGVPSNLLVAASSAAGAVVNFSSPTAVDAVSGTVAVSCNRMSGATFVIGSTTVTCTATDGSGNQATGTFSIEVSEDAEDCKRDGWRKFSQPSFPNQAQCNSTMQKVKTKKK